MRKTKKYKNALEEFVSSDKGQRFFNIAYSIGAAVVIWGALFKILHIRGGDILLAVGMGTEVLMFILTAFDRPPREFDWDKVFPELTDGEPLVKPKQPVHESVAPVEGLPDADVIANEIDSLKKDMTENFSGYMDRMQELNRNLSRLNAIYESTLSKSTLYCEESEKMARNMQQLNRIYDNMLKAMSVNMSGTPCPSRINQSETEK